MTRAALVILLVLLPSACAHPSGPAGHATSHVPGIRIITATEAEQRGLTGRPFALRFGDNQDGTKLVLDYLEAAKKAGGRYVSDIQIRLLTPRGGERVRCVTRILPFAKRGSYTVQKQIPGRTETRSVMKPVTRMVTETQYQCRSVSKPVTRMETRYEYQYDYTTKSSRSVPVSRMVTRYEYRQECRHVPVTRMVTRYEHQLETRYIPPRLKYIAAHYTDFNLIEDTPRCEPARSSRREGGLPHQIWGMIYPQRP
jgi:hypothetical protein